MTANNASKLTHVYNSLKCIYEARYEDVGKPQALAGMTAFVNDKAGGETRQDMKEAIAKNLGEKDPEAGLAWAAENLSGDRRHEAVKEILIRLAKKRK